MNYKLGMILVVKFWGYVEGKVDLWTRER